MRAVANGLRLRATREALQLAALAAICGAETWDRGYLTPGAIALVVAGLALAGLSLRAPVGPAPRAVWVACAGLLALLNLYWLGIATSTAAYLAIVATLGISAVAAVAGPRRLRGVALAVAAAAALGLVVATWQWAYTGNETILSVRNASAAVARLGNPYDTVFPLWVRVGATGHYEPAHFQYGPAAAILGVPGQLVGDVRVVYALASAALVVLVVALRDRSGGDRRDGRIGVATLCLAMPLTVGIIRWGWVDVEVMAGLAAWAVLRRRRPAAAAAALALAALVKPTLLPAVLPALVWSPRARRESLVAAGFAAAVALPYLLATSARGLWDDVIGVQARLAPRYDSLTLRSAAHTWLGTDLPSWLPIAVIAVVTIAVLRHRPRDEGDLFAAAAVITGTGFVLAKWAFFNYYYEVAWLLLIAVAAGEHAFDVRVALPGWLTARAPRAPALRRSGPARR